MKKHRKLEFSHGRWWLRMISPTSRCLSEDQEGTCDPPEKLGRKWIYIREGLTQRRELEVVLHEIAHAADPRASEEAIEEQSRIQAQVLWAMGWRKRMPKEKRK